MDEVDALLEVGDPISIYGTCGAGRPESAHLIHCNLMNQDGAIVANSTFQLFHFATQTF